MKDNRFYLARTKYNQHGFQSAAEVYKNTGVSRSLLDSLESAEKRNVSYFTVAKLAQYYGVSTDYLTGLSDIPSLSPEIRAICEYTGLAERAVKALHFMNEADTVEPKRSLSLINKVLSDDGLSETIEKENRDSLLETLFSLIDQYVTADNAERALDFESMMETGEKHNPGIATDYLKRFITIRSSGDLSEIIDVPGLYAEYKMTQIRKIMDGMKSQKGE